MCWKCSAPLDGGTRIFRSAVCPECGSDLHSCRNCRFYEPGAHYDCRETVDELVKDKERSNFCGFFSAAAGRTGRASSESKDARSAFDGLFSL